jgi:hypothetical protein
LAGRVSKETFCISGHYNTQHPAQMQIILGHAVFYGKMHAEVTVTKPQCPFCVPRMDKKQTASTAKQLPQYLKQLLPRLQLSTSRG